MSLYHLIQSPFICMLAVIDKKYYSGPPDQIVLINFSVVAIKCIYLGCS